MQWILIATLVLHLLGGVFWAGSSFVLARGLIPVETSLKLRRSQRGAAIGAVLTGILLGGLAHRGGAGATEITLSIGALAALVAMGLQFVFGVRATRAVAAGGLDEPRKRQLLAIDRLCAFLLVVTVACMAASKYI